MMVWLTVVEGDGLVNSGCGDKGFGDEVCGGEDFGESCEGLCITHEGEKCYK